MPRSSKQASYLIFPHKNLLLFCALPTLSTSPPRLTLLDLITLISFGKQQCKKLRPRIEVLQYQRKSHYWSVVERSPVKTLCLAIRLRSSVVSWRPSTQFLGFYLKLGQTAFWQTYSFSSFTDRPNTRRSMAWAIENAKKTHRIHTFHVIWYIWKPICWNVSGNLS